MNRQVLLDLETLGKNSFAVILSIGAVLINVRTNEIESEFYAQINLESAVDTSGGIVDGSTIEWWLDQERAARNELIGQSTTYQEALLQFSGWMRNNHTKDMGVWGNGVRFDNTILGNGYQRLKMDEPWSYKQDRCYRTLSALHKNIAKDVPLGTVKHNALHDARRDAYHLAKILQKTGHEYATLTG